jgi:hypothetical protein
MKSITRLFTLLVIVLIVFPAFAHINPELHGIAPQGGTVSFRNDCAQATQQIEMSINNVRALLLNGGDVWWDLSDGRYVVPMWTRRRGTSGIIHFCRCRLDRWI